MGMDAIVAALLGKAIDKKDPAISNVGVKNRLDAMGAALNELRTGWNANITGTKLVVPAMTAALDYPKTFVEV